MIRNRSLAVLLFASLLLSIAVTAERAEAVLETGLSVGVNFASLEDVDVKDGATTWESKTGWHFGLYMKSALGPLGVRAGAIYLDAGPLFEGLSDKLDDPSGFEDDFDVRFLVIPVDLQYRLVTPAITPYLLAGPELRFNMTSADDFDDNFKDTSWGGNIGAGIEFTLPVVGIAVAPEFRYTFDLTGMTEEDLTIVTETLKASDSFQSGTYHVRVHFSF